MIPEEIDKISLPKWAAFVVVGKPVNSNRAKEIIMRTSDLYHFSTNDREFEHQLYKSLGFNHKGTEFGVFQVDNYEEISEQIKNEIQPLGLDYCQNSRIVSCWIGGPHGWIDWYGNIGCHNYNIGKWPNALEVYKEWQDIATAFPDLDLQCQLFAHEAGCEEIPEGDELPLIQFNIKDGEVSAIKPPGAIANPSFEVDIDTILSGNVKRERGCSIEQFINAYKYTKSQIAKPKG